MTTPDHKPVCRCGDYLEDHQRAPMSFNHAPVTCCDEGVCRTAPDPVVAAISSFVNDNGAGDCYSGGVPYEFIQAFDAALPLARAQAALVAPLNEVQELLGELYSFTLKFHDGRTQTKLVRGVQFPEELRPPEPYWKATLMTASAEYYGAWGRLFEAKGDTPQEAMNAALAGYRRALEAM